MVAARCCCGSRAPVASTCRRSTTSPTCPTAGSSASRPPPTPTACRGGSPSTPSWTSTRGPTRSSRSCRVAESVHERMSVEIFRGCTRGCRFCQAGMITRPVRERSITGIGEMVERGLAATGFEEVGLLSLSLGRPLRDRRPHQGPRRPLRGHADRAVAAVDPRRRLQHRPRQRADPQRSPLGPDLRPRGWLRAHPQGDQQDGVRGGPHQHRRRGLWRRLAAGQALLHVRAAHRDRRGRPADRRAGQEGHRDRAAGLGPPRHPLHGVDRRLRAQAAHALPVGVPARRRGDRRPARQAARGAPRPTGATARSIGFRYHDGQPGVVEGLLSRGDRRVGKVIEAVWRDGGRFDGWSEHFSYERWMRAAETALADEPVDVAWFTTREREQNEVLPWDHLDSGLDKDWLWEDWQDALDETEVDDCRWTPCFDCGVCPQMGTEIEIGPDRQDAAAADRARRRAARTSSSTSTDRRSRQRCAVARPPVPGVPTAQLLGIWHPRGPGGARGCAGPSVRSECSDGEEDARHVGYRDAGAVRRVGQDDVACRRPRRARGAVRRGR